MVILQLISSEGYYGAENMLMALSRALSRQRCRVLIGVLRDARNPHTEIADAARREGMEVELIECSGRFDRGAISHVKRLVKSHGADVLHTHGYKADLFGWLAARNLPVRLTASCHGWPNPLFVMQAYAKLDRLVLRSFQDVVAVSESVAGILRKSGIGNTRVIENGVECERFAPGHVKPGNGIREGNGPVIGFVGRLVREKGGATLLEAARTVVASVPEARFVLVGDGECRGEWQDTARRVGIERNVTFAGVRGDMPGVYAGMDLFVLPSHTEAMPMCVLEAMASAKPVIATRVGGVPRAVLPEQTGVLIEPGDAAALARAILRLLGSKAQRDELGRTARAHVVEHFSADAMANEYLRVYQEGGPIPAPAGMARVF